MGPARARDALVRRGEEALGGVFDARHFRLRHVRQRLLVSMLVTLGGLALLAWLAAQPAFYAAFGVATMTRELTDGVTTVTEYGSLTLVFRKDPNAGWLIVGEHYSYKRPG